MTVERTSTCTAADSNMRRNGRAPKDEGDPQLTSISAQWEMQIHKPAVIIHMYIIPGKHIVGGQARVSAYSLSQRYLGMRSLTYLVKNSE